MRVRLIQLRVGPLCRGEWGKEGKRVRSFPFDIFREKYARRPGKESRNPESQTPGTLRLLPSRSMGLTYRAGYVHKRLVVRLITQPPPDLDDMFSEPCVSGWDWSSFHLKVQFPLSVTTSLLLPCVTAPHLYVVRRAVHNVALDSLQGEHTPSHVSAKRELRRGLPKCG